MKPAATSASGKSEFLGSVQKGLLLGAAILALVLPPSLGARRAGPPSLQAATRQASGEDASRRADFAGVTPSEDVRQLANWTVVVGDHQHKSFVIVDKKDARVYVFDRTGHLKSDSPVLLGSAVGDDNAPNIGTKPIADVLPEERTTPAGRYVAEMGMNTRGEDVVWVDYEAAVSMHRVLTTNPAEHRLERLASPTPEDNRISYGCINLPRDFYEQVLGPTVRSDGAIIYILPETRSAQQVFGSWDVDRPATRLAQR
ncbi:MAG: hypothetical protein JWQ07_3833 [Ramlibacter sp.]|nr:hypothetical protein [Ramlibacter sp.]